MKKNKGITLMTLTVTIIILMIIAGISIFTLSGDNNILRISGDAKTNTEKSSEIEVVKKSVIEAMGNDKHGNLEKNMLENRLRENLEGKDFDVGENDSEYIVTFNDTNNSYKVDFQGNVEEVS